jgi:hypothetical protein
MCDQQCPNGDAQKSLVSSAKSLVSALDEFANEYGLAILRGGALSSTAAGEFASLLRSSELLERAIAGVRETAGGT